MSLHSWFTQKIKNCQPNDCKKLKPSQNPAKCEQFEMSHFENCKMQNSNCNSNGKG